MCVHTANPKAKQNWSQSQGLREGSPGCWVLGAGYWVLGVGCWVLGVGCWVLSAGSGCWVLSAKWEGDRWTVPIRERISGKGEF